MRNTPPFEIVLKTRKRMFQILQPDTCIDGFAQEHELCKSIRLKILSFLSTDLGIVLRYQHVALQATGNLYASRIVLSCH